jgi:hypothetical protein
MNPVISPIAILFVLLMLLLLAMTEDRHPQ